MGISLTWNPKERQILLENTYPLSGVSALPSGCIFLMASRSKRMAAVLCCGTGVTGLQWEVPWDACWCQYIYRKDLSILCLCPAVLRCAGPYSPASLKDRGFPVSSKQAGIVICLQTLKWLFSHSFCLLTAAFKVTNVNRIVVTVICIAFFKVFDVAVPDNLISSVHHVFKSVRLWTIFKCM